MAFWEYAAVMGTIDSKGFTREFLDRMGEQEWELVCVTPTGYGVYDFKPFNRDNEQFGIYYFKRPAQPKGLIAGLVNGIAKALLWGRQSQRLPAPDRMPHLPEPVLPER